MKKLFRKIHLWLSVPFGLIISIICLSGAALVFEDEITELCYPERYHVEKVGEKPLSVEELMIKVAATLPDSVSVTGVSISSDPERTYQVSLSKPRRASVFVDQYTGEVIGKNERASFFTFMFRMHRWLLDSMKPDGGIFWGKMIVGTSTLLMVIVLISGIVIWWPRTRKALKNGLKITVGKGLKRFWFDLHVAGGMYALVFLLAMALTGLTWSFPWYRTAFYKVFGVEMQQQAPHGPGGGNASHGGERKQVAENGGKAGGAREGRGGRHQEGAGRGEASGEGVGAREGRGGRPQDGAGRGESSGEGGAAREGRGGRHQEGAGRGEASGEGGVAREGRDGKPQDAAGRGESSVEGGVAREGRDGKSQEGAGRGDASGEGGGAREGKGGKPQDGANPMEVSGEPAQSTFACWQEVYDQLRSQNEGYKQIGVTDGSATVSFDRLGNRRAADRYTFDSTNGKITEANLYENQDKSGKIRGWIYSVHVGNWGGLPTRILTFLAALIGASLPLTGYYLWIKKWMGKRKRTKKTTSLSA